MLFSYARAWPYAARYDIDRHQFFYVPVVR